MLIIGGQHVCVWICGMVENVLGHISKLTRACSSAPAGTVSVGLAVSNPAGWYDGWSSFKQLKDKEPPLVLAYSNPLKCKLTTEVHANRLNHPPDVLLSLPETSPSRVCLRILWPSALAAL